MRRWSLEQQDKICVSSVFLPVIFISFIDLFHCMIRSHCRISYYTFTDRKTVFRFFHSNELLDPQTGNLYEFMLVRRSVCMYVCNCNQLFSESFHQFFLKFCTETEIQKQKNRRDRSGFSRKIPFCSKLSKKAQSGGNFLYFIKLCLYFVLKVT